MGPRRIFWGCLLVVVPQVACALRFPRPFRFIRHHHLQTGTALTTSGAVAVAAAYELTESLTEVGHSHGLLLLSLSKMAHAAQLFGDAGRETAEEVGRFCWWRRLFNTRTMQVISILALFAALNEIYVDVKPGGHHGTALLALAEFRETFARAMRTAGGVSFFSSLLSFLVFSCWSKLLLGLGAFGCAFLELRHDLLAVGAHHGVAVFAAALTIKSLGEVVQVLLRSYEKNAKGSPGSGGDASPKTTKLA